MNELVLVYYYCLFILSVSLLYLHFTSNPNKWFLLPPVVALGFMVAYIWLTLSSVSHAIEMLEDRVGEEIFHIKRSMRNCLSTPYIQKVLDGSLTHN